MVFSGSASPRYVLLYPAGARSIPACRTVVARPLARSGRLVRWGTWSGRGPPPVAVRAPGEVG